MSPVGAKSSSFWRVVLNLSVLLALIACLTLFKSIFNFPPPIPTSTVLPQSTSTPLTTNLPPVTGVAVIPEVEILVTPVNNNPFDSFDIKTAFIRVSDPPTPGASLTKVDSGADGHLKLPCGSGQSILTWAPGYEIKSVQCDGHTTTYGISLTHLAAIDNTSYPWLSAISDCNNCHSNRRNPNDPAGPSFDEMNEWFKSGHAKVFSSRYFESMYRGISLTGKPSIPAQPVIIANEWVPVPPEKSLDYHGPGFKLDFPGQPGNCAYCHAPASISASQQSMDLSNLFPNPGGSWVEGVTCDVCHKVFDVILADNRFPFTDRPGILSYRFLRPNSGRFMTGPFSNVFTAGLSIPVDDHSTCAPIYSQSEFRAPCHFGKFGDMFVYNSYGEWKASPYAANPQDPNYRTCQDCHMSHIYRGEGDSLSSERQACSANNTRFQYFYHNMMDFGTYGSSNQEIPRMVQNAAQIDLAFDTQPTGTNTLDVRVSVTNMRAGHNFPTDSPLRHLILVVSAEDRVRTPLIQVGGERIPNWAGPGPISPLDIANTLDRYGIKDYSGLAGKIFANLLVEEETNLSPGMAYWNETKYAFVNSVNGASSDNRLRPRVSDASTYSFAMPDAGNVKITVQLIYRFAFYDLMVWKEWFDRPDILVVKMECNGPPTQPETLLQSCVKVEPLVP